MNITCTKKLPLQHKIKIGIGIQAQAQGRSSELRDLGTELVYMDMAEVGHGRDCYVEVGQDDKVGWSTIIGDR